MSVRNTSLRGLSLIVVGLLMVALAVGTAYAAGTWSKTVEGVDLDAETLIWGTPFTSDWGSIADSLSSQNIESIQALSIGTVQCDLSPNTDWDTGWVQNNNADYASVGSGHDWHYCAYLQKATGNSYHYFGDSSVPLEENPGTSRVTYGPVTE